MAIAGGSLGHTHLPDVLVTLLQLPQLGHGVVAEGLVQGAVPKLVPEVRVSLPPPPAASLSVCSSSPPPDGGESVGEKGGGGGREGGREGRGRGPLAGGGPQT